MTSSEEAAPKMKLQTKTNGPRWGCRHTQACLWWLALMVGIATRTNLSVAIVAMTDNTTSSNPDVPTYDWTNTSVILSSFFWSYIIFQVLAGHLGRTYGPKYFLLTAMIINFCITGCIPLAASFWGWQGVLVCRIAQGLSHGFLYPSINVFMGTWCPDKERTTLNSYVLAGHSVGVMFGSVVTGYVSASRWGWPLSFYILALCGLGWCLLWMQFGHNSPASHPSISAEERYYIQSSLHQEEEVDLPTPWRKIFTCLPFYALIASNVSEIWGNAILMTVVPTYLAKIMKFEIKSNGVISSIPSLLCVACQIILGPFSDWLISRQHLSTLNVRRLFQLISSYGQGLCLLWMTYINQTHAYQSEVVMALAQAISSCTFFGAAVNHLDLSPRFSGVMYGILNTIGQAVSIMAPLSVQFFVKDMDNQSQWRTIFVISTVLFFVGGTMFGIFLSADRQEWDGPDTQKAKKNKKLSVISFPGV